MEHSVLLTLVPRLSGKCAHIANLCVACIKLRRCGELWQAMLQFTGAGAVFDCTAGNGTLAKQCLRDGIPYFGLTKNAAHLAFVSNCIDMEALRVLTESDHPLYLQSLSDCITEHFKEELEAENAFELTEEECQAMSGEGSQNA